MAILCNLTVKEIKVWQKGKEKHFFSRMYKINQFASLFTISKCLSPYLETLLLVHSRIFPIHNWHPPAVVKRQNTACAGFLKTELAKFVGIYNGTAHN